MVEATPSTTGQSAPPVPLRVLVARRLALLLMPAVALAFVWQVTPLKHYIEPQAVADALGALRGTWWGPLLVTGISVVGCVLMVPLTLVVLAHGALYAFPLNLAVAEVSMLFASIGLYFVGQRAGAGVIDRVLPAELRASLDNLGAKGVLGLAALRWVPVAHFGLLSMSLGALNVPLSRFVLSTLIGQSVMVALWVVLGDRIRAGLLDPNLRTLGLLLGVMISVVAVALGLRIFSRWRKTRSADART